jgi:hypothetical protein
VCGARRWLDAAAHSLGEFSLDVVRIECPRCGRAGSYRLDGLVARFGADIALRGLILETPRGGVTAKPVALVPI